MNGSAKIQPTHRQRLAVVYVRQSDPRQVLRHLESAVNQRALRERLLELGWAKSQIIVIDDDQGRSAKHAAGRDGFQALAADVGLRKVGIIFGYEVSRLSRNNADWYRLLELCSLFDTLIGDSDGIYHPRDFNDRLLLGLKGTMSEAELHSLRLRLHAGRVSKAKRGELVQQLPTGLVRDADGRVVMEADAAIRERIYLVFKKVLELGSAQKLLRYLVKNDLKLPRRQTSGVHAGDVLWKPPGIDALHPMLKNPAYAGAFAHGRRIVDPTRQTPGRSATGRIRQPPSEWLALVKDKYPAYISWEDYERIQQMLEANQQKMQERLTPKQTHRAGTALLTGLVRCRKCALSMNVAYKDRRFSYKCDQARGRYGQRTCQYLPGLAIDEAVTKEFFEVLKAAQIDALEQVTAREAEHRGELARHLQQEVVRLEYAASRAEKQYRCVDPENRQVTATLEKNWEQALLELEQAREKLLAAEEHVPRPTAISAELRRAFADVGKRLPEVWPQLSAEARKSLIRTLVSGVHLERQADGTVQVRIVWCGGLVTEKRVPVSVHSWRHSDYERQVVERIRDLAEQGVSQSEIAERLNREGFRPCRGTAFTRQIILKLSHQHGIAHNLQKVRRGGLASGFTVKEMASKIRIDPSWIYRKISEGRLDLPRDEQYGCYLFPNTKKAVETMKKLRKGEIEHASFRRVHHDG